MKCIKKLILMMIPVIFLVGCSTSGMNDKNVSKEAIERYYDKSTKRCKCNHG